MRILVTGNCGFIGQTFCRMFLRFHDIFGVDAMRYAADPSALEIVPTFVEDITDSDAMGRVIAEVQPEAVVNFAAESHVDRSIADSCPFVRSNVLGVQVLLEASRAHGVRRFLQISTDEVYGDLRPDDPPFSALHELRPSSPYSASKAAADMLVLAYRRTHGMDVVITRTCNNYGPHQYPEKLVPVTATSLLAGERVPVHGDGSNVREWIHVRDNCRAVMAALEDGRPGAIYNIGTGVELTNLDMVRRICHIMGVGDEALSFVGDRPGNDLRYAVDWTTAREELNWSPSIGIDEGLEETIAWYQENTSWELEESPRQIAEGEVAGKPSSAWNTEARA